MSGPAAKAVTRLGVFVAAFAIGNVMAIEEAQYEVLQRDGNIELRRYAPSIVAETVVQEDFEDAGNAAFNRLFKFISGQNEGRREIAMTAPVSQRPPPEKIAMTSPVGQRAVEEGWAVSFMMPSAYTLETVPRPLDRSVLIREIPAHTAAAIRYSGFWSEKNYSEHLQRLTEWLERQGLQAAAPPIWARYDPPFKPWFMRRNEILVRLVP